MLALDTALQSRSVGYLGESGQADGCAAFQGSVDVGEGQFAVVLLVELVQSVRNGGSVRRISQIRRSVPFLFFFFFQM